MRCNSSSQPFSKMSPHWGVKKNFPLSRENPVIEEMEKRRKMLNCKIGKKIETIWQKKKSKFYIKEVK